MIRDILYPVVATLLSAWSVCCGIGIWSAVGKVIRMTWHEGDMLVFVVAAPILAATATAICLLVGAFLVYIPWHMVVARYRIRYGKEGFARRSCTRRQRKEHRAKRRMPLNWQDEMRKGGDT